MNGWWHCWGSWTPGTGHGACPAEGWSSCPARGSTTPGAFGGLVHTSESLRTGGERGVGRRGWPLWPGGRAASQVPPWCSCVWDGHGTKAGGKEARVAFCSMILQPLWARPSSQSRACVVIPKLGAWSCAHAMWRYAFGQKYSASLLSNVKESCFASNLG